MRGWVGGLVVVCLVFALDHRSRAQVGSCGDVVGS